VHRRRHSAGAIAAFMMALLLGAALENFLSKKSFQTVFFVSAML
jgi:hypothetical protein